MTRRIARLLYPYGSERRVLRGTGRGMKFIVDRGMGMSFALGRDAAAPRCFERWLRPGMTVFDLGANRGQMTLLFAALVGPSGRVLAFEPAPEPFESLQRNVALNGLDQVRVLNVAVSDCIQDQPFLYAADSPTQGRLTAVASDDDAARGQQLLVRSLPLDNLLTEEYGPDFVKIDVEGGAGPVLRGARRTLERTRPVIYIELHGPDECLAVRDELLTRGYVARALDGQAISDPVATWRSPLVCTSVCGA